MLFLCENYQAMAANTVLEKRYSEWLSDKQLIQECRLKFCLSITFHCNYLFQQFIIAFQTIWNNEDFPTHPDIR